MGDASVDRANSLSQPTNLRKRHLSSSPQGSDAEDDNPDHAVPAHLTIRKRRRQNQNVTVEAATCQNPLDVLALAASTRPHEPATLQIKPPRRRVLLLNSPYPSPLLAQNKFDLLTSLLSHVDILLNITSHLHPQTLLNLYSVSAAFHYIMDSHFTAFILAGTRLWAPKAEVIFPWWCYRRLCIEDPTLQPTRTADEKRSLSWTDRNGVPHRTIYHALASARAEPIDRRGQRKVSDEHRRVSDQARKSREEEAGGAGVVVRAIPGFRWLKMVVYREAVSREIIGWMAAHGHRIARDEGVDAVKRMWFLLDIPVNAPRHALIHNPVYFTTSTLYHLQLIFIKLEMLYTDPVSRAGGEERLVHFLLSERTLTTLWNFLRGADGSSRLEVLRLWVKHSYRRPVPFPRPMPQVVHEAWLARQEMPVLGVPAHLVGRWGYECWGLGREKLIRPDELLVREGVRRRLELQREWIRMMTYGFLDRTLTPLAEAKADEVVVSLVRRKKNKEREEKEKRERREEMGRVVEDVVMQDAALEDKCKKNAKGKGKAKVEVNEVKQQEEDELDLVRQKLVEMLKI
ncbi:hypothetical protein AAFC00_003282 [Neodothiora populina]|uniref:F-box domain-containing protein n=1 Tax=Neodothiora populina TaxID=2781224 RepID=A0ABR3PA05_9PEZI